MSETILAPCCIGPTATPLPDAVAGEKDACGVGFLAQLSGEASHWVLQQALRGSGMHGAPWRLRW